MLLLFSNGSECLASSWLVLCKERGKKNPSDSFLVRLEYHVPVCFVKVNPCWDIWLLGCVHRLVWADCLRGFSFPSPWERLYGSVSFAISPCFHAVGVLVLIVSACWIWLCCPWVVDLCWKNEGENGNRPSVHWLAGMESMGPFVEKSSMFSLSSTYVDY